MVENYEPTQKESGQCFEDEHMDWLRVGTLKQWHKIVVNGSHKSDWGAKPENFSGHAGCYHKSFRFALFFDNGISLRYQSLILFGVFGDQEPSVILNETTNLKNKASSYFLSSWRKSEKLDEGGEDLLEWCHCIMLVIILGYSIDEQISIGYVIKSIC